jgi:Holliday junction resolvase-like predicted endonuclease
MATTLKRLFWTAVAAGVVQGGAARAEHLVPHPAVVRQAVWTHQLGAFGESAVREWMRATGKQVVDLNMGKQGIDLLAREVGPDGRVRYIIGEVKALTDGTDFQLKETVGDGRQLSRPWVESRLDRAARLHPSADCRRMAREALDALRTNPAAVTAELHGIGVKANVYDIRRVDMGTARFVPGPDGQLPRSMKLTRLLGSLSDRATDPYVRAAAAKHLRTFQLIRAACPTAAVPEAAVLTVARAAGVDVESARKVLTEAAEHPPAAGGARWAKVGGKVVKVAGPAGAVLAVGVFTVEAAEIEQRADRGEISREQADAEIGKLAAGAAAGAGGGIVGMAGGAAIGTAVCPLVGTIIGGIVGGVGGGFGGEWVGRVSGATDAIGPWFGSKYRWLKDQVR